MNALDQTVLELINGAGQAADSLLDDLRKLGRIQSTDCLVQFAQLRVDGGFDVVKDLGIVHGWEVKGALNGSSNGVHDIAWDGK